MAIKSSKVPTSKDQPVDAVPAVPAAAIPTELMTVEEAASFLRVDPKTVYRLISLDELKAILIGRVYRVDRADLNEFLQQAKLKTQRLAKKKY